MFLERLNGEMPWVLQRKSAYLMEKLPRKPGVPGCIRSTTGQMLMQLGFIEQKCGHAFVVTKMGERYYEVHLKPKA